MRLLRTVKLTKISSSSNGQYVRGRWVESKTEIENFRGTWQPARGRVMELLPEGKRNRETFICYAPIDMEFTSADPESGKSGDLILWEDKLYEVVLSSKWKNMLINHWELVCVRKIEGTKVSFNPGEYKESVGVSEKETHNAGE